MQHRNIKLTKYKVTMTTRGSVAVFLLKCDEAAAQQGFDVCHFLILTHCDALVVMNTRFSVRMDYGVSTQEHCVEPTSRDVSSAQKLSQ